MKNYKWIIIKLVLVFGLSFNIYASTSTLDSSTTEKSVILVNDINNIDTVSQEFIKIMGDIDVIGANEIANGTKTLDNYKTLSCFIYGGDSAVSNFTNDVLEKIKIDIENGAIFISNGEVCGGKVFDYLGIRNYGAKSDWYPALEDSAFIIDYEDNKLFEGVAKYSGNPKDYDVYYWDSGDYNNLIFRVDNSRSYTDRYGTVGDYLKIPDTYLAKGFSTGWSVSDMQDKYPQWNIGNGKVIEASNLNWTFNQSTKEGGYIGIAGQQILKNIASGISDDVNQISDTTNTEDKTVASFVTRLYENILGREPDEAGLDDWVNYINSTSAEDAVMGFFYSQEFLSKNLTDEDFIKVTYTTILGREADDIGLDYWVSELNNGMSRLDILYGFLRSDEFENLADEYGIKATNTTTTDTTYPTTGVEGFVYRMYTEILNREPDSTGFDSWVTQLQSGTKAAADIAKGFFNSEEFKNRNLNDKEFVDTAYMAFFGREADIAGEESWLEKLSQGYSRDDVLNGFIYSSEFVTLANSYGIVAYFENEPTSSVPEEPQDSVLAQYVGNWSGISHLYLTYNSNIYCKWRWDVTISDNGTGTIYSTLIEHNGDEGYCASEGSASFSMTDITDDGFLGVLISSDTALFGGRDSMYVQNQGTQLYNLTNLDIYGYSAQSVLTLTKQ